MDTNFPPEPASASVCLPEMPSLVSRVTALLDIARLEIDEDPHVAKASIVGASALLLQFTDLAAAPTTTLNAERPQMPATAHKNADPSCQSE
jgi:hypothetical protein